MNTIHEYRMGVNPIDDRPFPRMVGDMLFRIDGPREIVTDKWTGRAWFLDGLTREGGPLKERQHRGAAPMVCEYDWFVKREGHWVLA